MYILNFLEPAQFLNAPDLAGHKVNVGTLQPWFSRETPPLHSQQNIKCLGFLGQNGNSLRSLPFQAPNKSRFSGPAPYNRPRNVFAPHQNHSSPRHLINRFINSYYVPWCSTLAWGGSSYGSYICHLGQQRSSLGTCQS